MKHILHSATDCRVETHEHISFLQWSTKHERILHSGPLRLNMGPSFDKHAEWGFFDGSLRFFQSGSRRVRPLEFLAFREFTDVTKFVGLFEHIHIDQITAAIFADAKTLITAGNACTISVWSVISSSKSGDLQPKKTLFGHRAAIATLAVSRSFSTLLSAASDGQVILWDLNRLEFVRILTSGAPVEVSLIPPQSCDYLTLSQCARINDVTGNVVLCRGSEASLWSLNGDSLLTQEIPSDGDNRISSCAFYEGVGNEYLERQLVFTGHQRGIVNVSASG